MAKTVDRISADSFQLNLATAKVDMDAAGAKMGKWNGESSIGLALPFAQTVPQLDKDKIVYSRPEMDVEFSSDGEMLEYEIVLKAPPKDSKLVLPCDMQNLQPFYQGELDAQDKLDGCVRPLNVIGSYAFYHGSRVAFMVDGVGGKFGHLYCPEAIRADGRKLRIPPILNSTSLVLPLDPSFFGGPYPIRIDPTFGETGVGGSGTTVYSGNLYGQDHTGAVGTGVDMRLYCVGSVTFAMALYVGNDVITNGDAGEVGGAPVPSWITATFGTGPTLSIQTYRLVFWSEANIAAYFDSGGTYHTSGNAYNHPTWPTASWEQSGQSRLWSLFCNYSVEGGLSIPIAMHHYKQMAGEN